MAKSMRDNITSGQNYSSDYLRASGLDQSRSFDTMYKLVRCRTKSASDSDVISMISEYGESTDTSNVYRVQSQNVCIQYYSTEFTASQTDTELLPAVTSKERYVILYGSIRTDANSGEACVHDDSDNDLLNCYFSRFQSVVADNLYIPMAKGEALKLTTTQGSKNLCVCINYFIETVEV